MSDVTAAEDCSVRSLPRGPNKKKYEEEYAACQNAVRIKEAEIKTLSSRLDDIRPELELLRGNKLSLNQRRQSNHDNLSKVGQEIIKLEADLARVQSSLQYRNETKINDAIHRFETQLRTKNFSLIEEKKIVAEVDSLKRSKKNLGAYQALKRQTDEKRDHAKQLREQREKLQKEFTTVKRREEQLRVEWQTGQEQLGKIKQEVSDQNKKMNLMRKEFSEQEKLYNEQRRKHMQQIHRAKVEERKAAVEAHQQEIAEIEASVDPAESDRQLCTMLVKYLQRYVVADDDHDSKSSPSSSMQSLAGQSCHDSVEMDGMVRLHRKLDDKEQYSKTKVAKRSKKDKKKIDSRKPLVHTPEIFSQFAQFGLVPPSCPAEVLPVIEQLMSHFSSLSLPVTASSSSSEYTPLNEALPLLPDPNDAVLPPLAAENVPSSAASYNGSSIPTTPDVQFDMVIAPCLSLAGSSDLPPVDCVSSSFVADVVAPCACSAEQRLSQDSGTESDDHGTLRADNDTASVE